MAASVGAKSAVMAYVAALVGTVAEPLYLTLLTVPPTAPALTTAACGEPLKVTGELVTVRVGVAFWMTKFPAEAPVRELVLVESVGAKSAVTAYVPALVGTVADPLYLTLVTDPATDPITVAACGEPVKVTGELVTLSVGVTLLTT